jgi:hypothetical protein
MAHPDHSRLTTKPAASLRGSVAHPRPPSLIDGPEDDLLTSKELAAGLKVSGQWLKFLRRTGNGPAFTRLGQSKVVRYRRGDVIDWIRTSAA